MVIEIHLLVDLDWSPSLKVTTNDIRPPGRASGGSIFVQK